MRNTFWYTMVKFFVVAFVALLQLKWTLRIWHFYRKSSTANELVTENSKETYCVTVFFLYSVDDWIGCSTFLSCVCLQHTVSICCRMDMDTKPSETCISVCISQSHINVALYIRCICKEALFKTDHWTAIKSAFIIIFITVSTYSINRRSFSLVHLCICAYSQYFEFSFSRAFENYSVEHLFAYLTIRSEFDSA